MRRKDRMIEDKEILEIIQSENVLRLGLSKDNRPYVVPLNYGYIDGAFYIHCANEGKKIDMIKENPHVCIEIDTDHILVKGDEACSYTMKYRSVIAFGQAELITDLEEKKKGLDVLMSQFSDEMFTYPDKVVGKVTIIKVTVDEMTGKA
jgi:nitroimidazol reductase NimA-like FMN-containing flavoprotein (pyridoxamine 5'-phosphate oxidase superfamily)